MIDHCGNNEDRRSQLSSLHRNIRLNTWNEVQLILEIDTSYFISSEAEWLNEKLIFTPNSVGWTALHFTILHYDSSYRLRWMISRMLEEYHHTRIHSLGYNESKADDCALSPFFAQTNTGYTSTDLFFAKRLFPFPFETNDVQKDANRLLKTIQFILKECQLSRESYHFYGTMEGSESPIIKDLRHRILMKRKYSCENDNWYSGSCPQPQSQAHSHYTELDNIMTNSGHYNEAIFYNNHYLEGLENIVDKGIANENVQELVDFWYDLEMILMAAVHETIYTECNFKNDTIQTVLMTKSSAENTILQKRKWSTVHALAKTGCPHEISELAILLYPEQVAEKDEHGNLPIHIACSSHFTSSYTEGDDLSYKVKRRNNKKYEQKQSYCCAPMIKTLLSVYPRATTIQNANHQLPLTLALCSGKNWYSGIYHIFQSNPSMILTGISRDKSTNLHFFMIAAASNHSEESTSLSRVDHRLAQRIISKKNIGVMWRSFRNSEAKRKAEKEAENELERMRLTTIYELLKINPSAYKQRQNGN